ncbi:MAG: prepilin-type N-terminal cleavage/methylation domain-containing protein [Legionellaceae bacterium]|nr:prepilin-type N-terminal cleavage/methylation domain-containing protein [Legionellaceae bacterium]
MKKCNYSLRSKERPYLAHSERKRFREMLIPAFAGTGASPCMLRFFETVFVQPALKSDRSPSVNSTRRAVTKKYQGQTLIELTVFIVILGIVLTGILQALQTVLFYSGQPGHILTASQLADARMNIIIQQRRIQGVTSMSDPCLTGSLNACTSINGFATTNGYVVSSSIPAAVNGVRTATVTVSGTGNATLIARFVQ